MASTNQSDHVHGKIAIVTGAAVGIGTAYAKSLAKAGAKLAICDVRDELWETARTLENHGAQVRAWQMDVGDAEKVHSMVAETKDAFGRIDILINNAGIWHASTADDPLDESLDAYDAVVSSNLKGHYLFGRTVIPHMIEQQCGGEIVNVATDHMVTCGTPWHVCPKLDSCPWRDSPRPTGGGDNMDLYDAAKWGLNGLLYSWAKVLAPHGIRVNQFCMGATDSNMLRSFHGFNPSADELASWMSAEDNAQALLDLLQEGPTGRNAANINFCVGRPVALEPPLPHRYVTSQEVELQRR